MSATLHLAIAVVAAGLDAVFLATLAAGAIRRELPRFLLDRLILAIEGAVVLEVLVGLLVATSGAGPADPLHFVYAVVALAALPVGRAWRGVSRGPRAVPLAVAAIVLAGVLIRLAQTG